MPYGQSAANAKLIDANIVEERMKYLSKLFATALVSLLAMGSVAQAQDMKFFRIGTGGTGGTYYPI
ncbi:MAG: immunogenic protein, partial [Candidatus Puniceispirillaceae bacterium]